MRLEERFEECRADGGRPVIPRVVRRLAGWDPRVPEWTGAAEKAVASLVTGPPTAPSPTHSGHSGYLGQSVDQLSSGPLGRTGQLGTAPVRVRTHTKTIRSVARSGSRDRHGGHCGAEASPKYPRRRPRVHSSRCSIPCLETFASVMSPGIQSGLSSGASSSQAQPS
jgi:hypothetical protein